MRNWLKFTWLNWFTALYVGIAIFGAFKFFSPVPYWDMWNGGLEWYLNSSQRGLEGLFAQHNEHRIVLTRLLFGFEYLAAGGSGAFLIACNYILVFTLVGLLAHLIMKSRNSNLDSAKRWLVPVAVILLFSWVQQENLNWTFQSQFILVYLLPILSFVFAQKYLQSHSRKFAFLSLVFGELSVWTMANGQLALYVLSIMLIIRLPKKFIGYVTLALALVSSFVYFSDYLPNAAHGSPVSNVMSNPIGFLEYIFAYLGNPVFQLTGANQASSVAAICTGLLIVVVATVTLSRYFLQQNKHTSLFAAAAGVLFIGLTAAITAAGRVGFGVEQAFSSRYATPTLIAYCLLFVLIIGLGLHNLGAKHFASWIAILCVVFQFHVLVDEPEEILVRRSASIAVAMGVSDVDATGRVFPSDTDYLRGIAKRASDADITVFSSEPLSKYLRDQAEPVTPTANCFIQVDQVSVLESDSRFMKLLGWIGGLPKGASVEFAEILSPEGLPLGLANIGFKRPDLVEAKVADSEYRGVAGYVLKSPERTANTQLPCRLY